jgi:hypothetical protein
MGVAVRPETYSPDNPFAPPETSVIPPALQAAFDDWIKRNGITDLDAPDSHYDYRGAFLSGLNRDSAGGHWPDTFKQHGHPTFSVESKYSKGPGDGGTWQGDTFMPPALADSLVAMTGGKEPGGGVSPDAVDVGGGEYNPKTDELWTATNASREVVTHEFGHRYDRTGALRSIIPSAAAASGQPTHGHQFDANSRSYEYAADTFARAVGFLQDPASRGPDAINDLGAIEAQQPGTGEVVRKLLQDPTYANHPLRSQVTAPPRTATDDTAVARKRPPSTARSAFSPDIPFAPE